MVLIAVFAFSGCITESSSYKGELHDKIHDKLMAYDAAYKAGKTQFIVFGIEELTNFDWDAVYFFYADSVSPSIKDISSAVGGEFTGRELHQGEQCWVFTKNNEVVNYVYFGPEEEFGFEGSEKPFPNNDSDLNIKISRHNSKVVCFECSDSNTVHIKPVSLFANYSASFNPCK